MKYINVKLQDKEGELFERNMKKLAKELGEPVKSSHLVRVFVKSFNEASKRGDARMFMNLL